jgi:hypothetical protein
MYDFICYNLVETLSTHCWFRKVSGVDSFNVRVASMSDAGDVVALQDGEARAMGDGVFVVVQDTEEGTQSIVLQRSDLEVLLALA